MSSSAVQHSRVDSLADACFPPPQKRALSAGPGWFDMPAFPGAATSKGSGMNVASASSKYVSSARGATAEEMRREVQAIRLRNAMDPKRFYRGGKADKGMPKFAQVSRLS